MRTCAATKDALTPTLTPTRSPTTTTAAHFAMNHSHRLPTRFTALAAVALAALASPAARAETPPPEAWYAGVHLGTGHVSGWPARVDFGGVSVDGRLEIGNGHRAGLVLGRHAGAWRIEAQLQRGTLPVSQARLGSVVQALDAEGSYRALTANLLRAVPLAEQWNLLAGLGLGVAQVKLPAVALANGCHCFAGASERKATVQARLGLEWRVAPGWRLQLAGGWLRLPGPTASSGNTTTHYDRRGVATGDLGLVIDF
jgi:opacity protein-like surface antigen